MKVKSLVLGPFGTNCYIIENNGKVLIIDPAAEKNTIIRAVGEKKVVGIIVTHYHPDHIEALDDIKKYYNAKVYDINNLKEGHNSIEDFKFEVIYTKGHTEDLITIYFKEEKKMFCGDFIFAGSIGRWDLEGGNFDKMKDSIRKILKYPEDITIYPGHGPITTLGREIYTLNYFLSLNF